MSNQTPENTPTTSSSSNKQGTTKVFILTPDVLKKLGIANKIPNLSAIHSSKNVFISTPKKTNSSSKTVENTNDNLEVKQNSVQSKLLSMLASKSKTIKDNSSSNSEGNKSDAKKLLNTNINNSSTDTAVKKIDMAKIFADRDQHPVKFKQIMNSSNISIPMSLKEENIKTKCNKTVNSTCTSKNIECLQSADVDSLESLKSKTTLRKDSEHKISCNEKNNIATNQATTEVVAKTNSTPRGRKRKLTPESPSEAESISPLRKSNRQRRLSTLHSDYVTELKLHDGSSQKISKRSRKSTEQKDVIDINKSNKTDHPNNTEVNQEDITDSEEYRNNNSIQNKLLNQSNNNNSENLISKSNDKCHEHIPVNKQTQVNKGIIIHENILITPPKSLEGTITSKIKSIISKDITITQSHDDNSNKMDSPKNVQQTLNVTDNTDLGLIKSTENDNDKQLNPVSNIKNINSRNEGKTSRKKKIEKKLDSEEEVFAVKAPNRTYPVKLKTKLTTDSQNKNMEISECENRTIGKNKIEYEKSIQSDKNTCPKSISTTNIENQEIITTTENKPKLNTDSVYDFKSTDPFESKQSKNVESNCEIKKDEPGKAVQNVNIVPKSTNETNIQKKEIIITPENKPILNTNSVYTNELNSTNYHECKKGKDVKISECNTLTIAKSKENEEPVQNKNRISKCTDTSNLEKKEIILTTENELIENIAVSLPIKHQKEGNKELIKNSKPEVSDIEKCPNEKLQFRENKNDSMVSQKEESTEKCELRNENSCITTSVSSIMKKDETIKNVIHELKTENSSDFKSTASIEIKIETPESASSETITVKEENIKDNIHELKTENSSNFETLPVSIETNSHKIMKANSSDIPKKLNSLNIAADSAPLKPVLKREENTESNIISELKKVNSTTSSETHIQEIIKDIKSEVAMNEGCVQIKKSFPDVEIKNEESSNNTTSETLLSVKLQTEKSQILDIESNKKVHPPDKMLNIPEINNDYPPLKEIKENNDEQESKMENLPEVKDQQKIISISTQDSIEINISENVTTTNQENNSDSVSLPSTDIKRNILETKRNTRENITMTKEIKSDSDEKNNTLDTNNDNLAVSSKEESSIDKASNQELNTVSTPVSIKEKVNTENVSSNPTENINEINSESSNYWKTPTRKRGRPAKRKNLEASTPQKVDESMESLNTTATTPVIENTEEDTPSDSKKYWTIPLRRKGRPPKSRRIESDEEESDESTPKKRNKRKKIETPPIPKVVTCAICNDVVKKSNWPHHTMKHNFLCWTTDEPPLDLNDKKLVEYILFRSVKSMKKVFKCFTCTSCGDKKKSVLGFMSHIDVCQLTDEEKEAIMVSCTVCEKKLLPQSMLYHMTTHKQPKKKQPEESNNEQSTSENTPRSKRKAAAKAVNLIQEVTNSETEALNKIKKDDLISGRKVYIKGSDRGNVFLNYGIILKFEQKFKQGLKNCTFPNCTFKSDEFKDLKTHLNECSEVKSNDYICRFCLRLEKDEKTIKEHVKVNHIGLDEFMTEETVESEDNEEEVEEVIVEKKKPPPTPKQLAEYIKPTYKVAFLAKVRRRCYSKVSTYFPAFKWTADFRQENYQKELFKNILCSTSDWVPLSLEDQKEYLPRITKSMSINTCSVRHSFPNVQQSEHEWKEYDLCEADITNDTINIFCGGPIWAFSWVPTPDNVTSDQYLAVSVQKDYEVTYKISESQSGKELIQFWNVGPLQCKRKVGKTPELEFSLAHNHGMIWYMEWCPSGYYDSQEPSNDKMLQKLGLLALACSDGYIYIYSIGKPRDVDENHKIFHSKPRYKLILQESSEQLLGQWKYQVTRLYWSKHLDHNVIAGGYSNGMVCLWDITTTSPLLKSEEDGVIILKPYYSLQAHSSAITALVLYPLIDGGKRWLLTGSWDRSFKYWDLNNTAMPFSIGKRGIVTDGVWITHWLCSFFSFDDVFNFGHTITTVQNPRDFAFKQCSALASNSVVMSLSSSDWASAIVQGSLAGEFTGSFPRTILMSYDVDKTLKCKRMMLSYNELIDKTKEISERKDIMKVERKSDKLFIDKDDKTFKKYLDNQELEPYVDEPPSYQDAIKKYGLVFCDINMDNFTAVPDEAFEIVKQSNRLREAPTELYPITSLNTVAWNPNKQAYLYVACGYQNGFVRIRCIRFMAHN